MSDLTRRRFIQGSAALAAGAVVLSEAGSPGQAAAAESKPFASRWDKCPDRVWLGPEYWANPLQDWKLSGGRIECVNAAPDRNVHLLTRQLGAKAGDLRMRVRVGRAGGKTLGKGKGSAGFRIGVMGPLHEYRNSLIFGRGLDAGLTADGGLFIGEVRTAKAGAVKLDRASVDLLLTAASNKDDKTYTVTLAAHDPKTDKSLGEVSRKNVPADKLVGNLALVANFGRPRRPRGQKQPPAGPGTGRFWFAGWQVDGDKVEAHDDRAFGPILFSQYTLSGGVMKMTAQMPPVGAKDSQTVRLQIAKGKPGEWSTIAEEKIHPQAHTATFSITKWDDKKDVPYRLAYTMTFADGRKEEHHWTGTVRRDPVDRDVLTVADVSCNIHAAFPNADYVAKMGKLDPDLLAFVGDQFYESSGGYGVTRKPLDPAILDYLRKWYMHGWTWRELTRDRPSVSLPDDHDVYQGNVWGAGGKRGEKPAGTKGGYSMAADWINVVHRTQTSHHPDPHDPTPIKQNISVYYGPMTYGRISFAIIADRMFKTGPEGVAPPTKGRPDHVTDADFDPKTADVKGAELLGERQMKFLREWVADWRGADMKAVVSQTIFTAMATTHGGNRQRLRADYDANGWPQSARNAALREMRKAFAVHIAGDQHLPALVHYGIDAHNDAAVAFAGPAINVGYPRWWEPKQAGKNRKRGAPENTGEFIDHFGHPLTVLAVKNGAAKPRRGVLEMMHDKASGLGLVRFDKARRKITFECWPYLADPSAPGTQFPGWPVTVDVLDNYGKKAVGHLPALDVRGVKSPVVQVVNEKDGEVLYTLRIAARSFRPPVFAAGTYTVRVSEPESGRMKEVKGVEASPDNKKTLRIDV